MVISTTTVSLNEKALWAPMDDHMLEPVKSFYFKCGIASRKYVQRHGGLEKPPLQDVVAQVIHALHGNLASGAGMAQREAAVCRELPAVAKQRRILHHVLDHRGARAAYERNAHQPGVQLAGLGALGDKLVNGSDVLVKGLYYLVPTLI